MTQVHLGVAAVLVALWHWAGLLPTAEVPNLVLGSAAILLGVLPRLFWPTVEWVQTAALIVSFVLLGVM